jgi:hypothetical protein
MRKMFANLIPLKFGAQRATDRLIQQRLDAIAYREVEAAKRRSPLIALEDSPVPPDLVPRTSS